MLIFYTLIIILIGLKYCDIGFKNKLISLVENSSDNSDKNSAERIRLELMNLLPDSIMFSLNEAIKKAKPEEKFELEECKNVFQIFNKTNQSKEVTNFYIYLLFYDASKSKNDLSPYLDCVNSQSFNLHELKISSEQRKRYIKESTYIVFNIKEKINKSITDFTYINHEHLFGLCMKKGCSENALKKLFLELNEIVILFENIDEEKFEIYDLKAQKENNKYWLIPIIIILLIMLLNPLNFLFKYLRMNQNNKLIKFIDCFNFNNNFKEILGKEQNDDSSNLSLIRGIRAIIFISVIISYSFFYIYHLPTKVINEIYLKSLLKSNAFPFIYHGARFGKKILYALSGLELTCKMFHYLDDLLKNHLQNIRNKDENSIDKDLFLKEANIDINKAEEDENDDEINKGKISLEKVEGNHLENEDEDEGYQNYLNFFFPFVGIIV